MDCKTCDELLAAYKDAVSRFKDSVRGIPGTGADPDWPPQRQTA
jgi:hypothetical protein